MQEEPNSESLELQTVLHSVVGEDNHGLGAPLIEVVVEDPAVLEAAKAEAVEALTKIGILKAGIGGLAFGNEISVNFFKTFDVRTAIPGLSATATWIVLRVVAESARYYRQEKQIDQATLDKVLALPEVAGLVFQAVVYNRYAVNGIAHLAHSRLAPTASTGIAVGLIAAEGLVGFLTYRSQPIKKLIASIPTWGARLVKETMTAIAVNGTVTTIVSPLLKTNPKTLSSAGLAVKTATPYVAATVAAAQLITQVTPLRDTKAGEVVKAACTGAKVLSVASLFLSSAMQIASGITGLAKNLPDDEDNATVPTAAWATLVGVTAFGLTTYITYNAIKWCRGDAEIVSGDVEVGEEDALTGGDGQPGYGALGSGV